MNSYIAFEAPAWLWILASFALVAAGLAFGALAAYAIGVGREVKRAHTRIGEHLKEEHVGPISKRVPLPVRP
jgi:hypothetical protein